MGIEILPLKILPWLYYSILPTLNLTRTTGAGKVVCSYLRDSILAGLEMFDNMSNISSYTLNL